MDDAPRTPATAAAPGPLASFARFVLCGGGVGVLSSFAVALLAALMPWGLANAVITVASTILCTELHARFTFGSGRRAGWREHWQSAGSATAAYVVTCAAMFILHLVQSSPSMLTEQIVYLSASGLAGVGRFVVLRVFVFATGRKETTTVETRVRETVSVRELVSVSVPQQLPMPIASTEAITCRTKATNSRSPHHKQSTHHALRSRRPQPHRQPRTRTTVPYPHATRRARDLRGSMVVSRL